MKEHDAAKQKLQRARQSLNIELKKQECEQKEQMDLGKKEARSDNQPSSYDDLRLFVIKRNQGRKCAELQETQNPDFLRHSL